MQKFSIKYYQTKFNNTLKELHTMIKGWKKGWLNVHNQSMWYTTLTNQKNHTNHMIISIDEEKAFDKIQHPFYIYNIYNPLCIYNGILHNKEWNFATCNNMDGFGAYYPKWIKSDRER